MSSDLKPCPFCGNPGEDWPWNLSVHCGCIGDQQIDFKSWQNAYCWKGISQRDERIKDLEAQNSVMKEALEDIANYPHPKFNGEKVWTISEVSATNKIAKDALSKAGKITTPDGTHGKKLHWPSGDVK
jgi:hypothetical protein